VTKPRGALQAQMMAGGGSLAAPGRRVSGGGQRRLVLGCLQLRLLEEGRVRGNPCISPGTPTQLSVESPGWSVHEEPPDPPPLVSPCSSGAGSHPSRWSCLGERLSVSSTQQRQLEKKLCKCFSCYFPCLVPAFPQRELEMVDR